MPSYPHHWRRTTPVSLALLPVAALFWLASSIRRALYRVGVLRSRSVRVPVVVVGNLVVGGAGKTPLVLALAAELLRRGYRPGIVSRGYGGSQAGPLEVHPGDDPAQVGDEAVLLAWRAAVPVWIARKRFKAAAGLIEAHPGCDLILSDDGLQHYGLARDVELIVEDERGKGNGWLLPAGPLREPADRRVDAIVLNGSSSVALGTNENAVPAFPMRLEFAGLRSVHDSTQAIDARSLTGRRLHAVAGIGSPERFFRFLDELGLHATPHAFPDHYRFTQQDLVFPACDAVLMTEKDAVKCRSLHRPADCEWYAVSVQAMLDPSFYDFLLNRLQQSPRGRTTA